MRTRIVFQYQPKGKRPDDVTLTDVPTTLTPGDQIPVIGEVVRVQLASNLREFRDRQPGNFVALQVMGRNFTYTTADGAGQAGIVDCMITLLVSDVYDNVIGVDTKE